MSKAYKCDGCEGLFDGEPTGGVVTRDGVKDACSPECFLIVSKRVDVCTIGELDDLRRRDTLPAPPDSGKPN